MPIFLGLLLVLECYIAKGRATTVYAGRSDTRVGEVMARLFGMRDRLISASSIDSKRILILDGGVRDELLVQFWVLPPDARESALALFDLPV